MFSIKSSVNQLASLMFAHGVTNVVVCPGSRNAPLVNDFSVLASLDMMKVYPVTDERSAAFVAIGIYLATRKPVAVCVTSGTALLNTLPAVAEAYYRHVPLLVVSADRPPQNIGQLKGQTLPQQGALQPYARTWQLPEEGGEEGLHICKEALASLYKVGCGPVHINVPLSKPLHIYNKEELDIPSAVRYEPEEQEFPIPDDIMEMVLQADLPALYVGQMDFPPEDVLARIDEKKCMLLLSETIGSSCTKTMQEYHMIPGLSNAFQPDVIIHVGGAGIDHDYSWLVRNKNAKVIRIEESDTETPDTFGCLAAVVRCDTIAALRQLKTFSVNIRVETFASISALRAAKMELSGNEKETNDPTSVPTKWNRELEQFINACRPLDMALHVGNSSILRYFRLGRLNPPHLLCNRGVNGIDGTLSVAAGHSMATDKLVFCMIGDLSFFYDSNALWNNRLRGNFRVLLLNDQGGGIFNHVEGLNSSDAFDMISGRHHSTAKGICESYGADYIAVNCHKDSDSPLYNKPIPQDVLAQLTAPPESRNRPLVVELIR